MRSVFALVAIWWIRLSSAMAALCINFAFVQWPEILQAPNGDVTVSRFFFTCLSARGNLLGPQLFRFLPTFASRALLTRRVAVFTD